MNPFVVAVASHCHLSQTGYALTRCSSFASLAGAESRKLALSGALEGLSGRAMRYRFWRYGASILCVGLEFSTASQSNYFATCIAAGLAKPIFASCPDAACKAPDLVGLHQNLSPRHHFGTACLIRPLLPGDRFDFSLLRPVSVAKSTKEIP